MNKHQFDRATRKAIVECGRMCERALTYAQKHLDKGEGWHAEAWLERTEWWARQSFREVDAALAGRALEAAA